MTVHRRFLMKRDEVGTCVGERANVAIRFGDHQVNIQGTSGAASDVGNHLGAEADVRYEMTVHDVEVDPFGAGTVDQVQAGCHVGKVGRQDRRRDDDRRLHDGP